jgi:hypothetical protein
LKQASGGFEFGSFCLAGHLRVAGFWHAFGECADGCAPIHAAPRAPSSLHCPSPLSNRKPRERQGKVQLIDGTRFFQKMKKSLNNKRNELSDAHITRLTELYANFEDGERERVLVDGAWEERVVSRIFDNAEFGFLKVTVERPLRLNVEATPERIARLKEQSDPIRLGQ